MAISEKAHVFAVQQVCYDGQSGTTRWVYDKVTHKTSSYQTLARLVGAKLALKGDLTTPQGRRESATEEIGPGLGQENILGKAVSRVDSLDLSSTSPSPEGVSTT